MIINLDIEKLVRRNLPAHMVQTNRIDLYWLVMREIDYVWQIYADFRDIKKKEQNITFSKLSLEWWLNFRLFSDGKAGKLEIIFGGGNPNFMELGTKGANPAAHVNLGIKGATTTESVELARKSDTFGSITTDFAVESAVTLDAKQKEQINLIIEQYRIAGVNYKIID